MNKMHTQRVEAKWFSLTPSVITYFSTNLERKMGKKNIMEFTVVNTNSGLPQRETALTQNSATAVI